MSLSDKGKHDEYEVENSPTTYYREEDVKEFIKEVKYIINQNQNITHRQKQNLAKDIKKLAGPKLI